MLNSGKAKNSGKNASLYFWLGTIAVFILLIVPVLIREGMFMDGQQYACVARNMANGKGSFWFPVLSDTWWKAGAPYFMEHPPLAYGLQSVFFRLMSDSIYAERLYSFLTAIFQIIIISGIWKTVFQEQIQIRSNAWYPVLLFISIPVVSWSFQNNIMENTMGIFTLLSVYFGMKSLLQSKHHYIYVLLSGIAVFLSFLSKGLPGLFPLILGFIYILIFRNENRIEVIISQLLVAGTAITLFLIFLLLPVSGDSLNFYLYKRLFFRISNEPTVSSRFFILGALIMQIGIPLVIVTIIWLFRQKYKPDPYQKRIAILFWGIGLSASLPLMLTPVQRTFYLLPSLPFFAIGLAAISAPQLLSLTNKIRTSRYVRLFSTGLLIISLTVSVLSVGKYSRDEAMIKDVKKLGQVIPENSIIGVTEDVYEQWNLQMYLLRYYNISVTPECTDQEFCLYPIQETVLTPESLILTELKLSNYRLYKKQ